LRKGKGTNHTLVIRKESENMDKIIFRSARLKCHLNKAFEMFTVNEHLEKWLTKVADVEPKMGGKYDLF